MNPFLIIFVYYIAWFSSLILASHNHPWLALVVSIGIGTIQLIFLSDLAKIPTWKKFFLCLTFIGFCVDSLLSFSSFIHFYANPWQPYLAPPWILGLWINFSVLCIGLRSFIYQLRSYLWIIALLGFPTAYLIGGIALNTAFFTHGAYSTLIVGLIWMLLLPLVCRSTL
jgi:hypothetical protein